MIRVLRMKELQQLLEKLAEHGDPVIICMKNGTVIVKKPWHPTPKQYADLSMDCEKSWIGIRVW